MPYYHKLFRNAGITPSDIQTVDDMYKIPISQKADLVNLDINEIVASNIDLKKCIPRKTSGTSGIPFNFYFTKEFQLENLLRIYRWQLLLGDKPLKKRLMIGGCWIHKTALEKIGILPAKRVSPFDKTSEHIKQIIKYKPYAMVVLPSALRVISNELIHQNMRIDVPLIFTGGEILDEHTKQVAKEAFNVEVFEGYGMTEIGSISGECRSHVGKHVWNDTVILEVIKNGESVSKGEKG